MKQILKKPLQAVQILGLLVATTMGLNAQTGTIQIGSGTNTGSIIPVAAWDYTYSQQIVTASEYIAENGVAGNITKIRWMFPSIGTTTNYGDWDVYIGHTTKTSFASNTDWVPIGDLTQVFSGNIHSLAIPPANNVWFEIEFSTPFNYDGVSNIVVAVNEKTPGWTGGPTKRSYTSGENTGIYVRKDGTPPYDPANPPSASGRTGILPQLQLEGQLASCLAPTNLSFTQTSMTGGDISWTANGSNVATYDVEWGTAGFSLGSGTQQFGLTTTSLSVATIQDADYEFYVRQNCTGSDGSSAWVGPYAFFSGYCRPSSQFASDRIASFSTTINGTTTQHYSTTVWEGAYINLSDTQTITQIEGQSVTFTEVYVGGNHHLRIWVDWDKNGTFEDSEEVFYEWGNGNNYMLNKSFTIPAGTPADSYRMRVRSQYKVTNPGPTGNVEVTPCGQLNYGSTLDFTLAVQVGTACSGTPTGGTATTSPSNAGTGETYSVVASGLEMSTDLTFQWEIYNEATATWDAIGTASATYSNLTGQIAPAFGQEVKYRLKTTCTSSNLFAYSTEAVFETGYCTPSSETINTDRIASFSTTINGTTTQHYSTTTYQGAYFNLSATQTITQNAGQDVTFTEVYFGGSHHTRIWVDWNKNGTFEDAEEVFYNYGTGNNWATNQSFTIPAGTPADSYRIRVRSEWKSTDPGAGGNLTLTPCGQLAYGSTLDLTLTVASASSCAPPTDLGFTQTSLTGGNLSWLANGTNAVSYDVEWGTAGFSQGSGTPINGITTTSTSVTTIQDTDYEFYVRQNCGADGQSSWVGPYAFKTGYCIPTYTSTSDYISSFITLDAATNVNYSATTTPVGNYENLSGTVIEQPAGVNINFTRTHVLAGHRLHIWVDFNNDGIFDPATEEVYAGNTDQADAPGIINLMNTAQGTYRMRIRSRWSSTNTDPIPPCGSSSWGSAIDYTLTLTTPPDCLPPAFFSYTQTSLTSADLSWMTNGSNIATYDVEWGTAGFSQGSGTPINGLTTTSTSVTTLQDTNYEFYVRQNCTGSDGSSVWVGPFAFRTGYCIPSFSDTADPPYEHINSFQTSGGTTNIVNLNTGKTTGGYANYTATHQHSTTQGTNVSYTITAGDDNVYFAIWVDLNQDGIFDNASERLYVTTGGIREASSSGTIPTTGLNGTYRIRVMGAFDESDIDDPCTSNFYGEVEDYTLVVTNATSCSPVTALNTSNVTQNSVDVVWTAGGSEALWNVEYGAEGFLQGSGTTINGVTNPYTITGLTAGTSYDVYVQADCGSGNESTWVMTSFTTDAAFTCPSPLNAGTVTTTPNSGSAGTIFDVTATGYDTGNDITYTWEKSEDNGANWTIVGTANATTYTDLIGETAPASGIVEYRLTVSCGGNTESASATFEVTVSRSNFDVFGFSYYPNPVNDMLHFSSNATIENVVITNMLGQQVSVLLSSDNKNLDMSNLPTGNYLVKITIEGVAKTIKVVKQ